MTQPMYLYRFGSVEFDEARQELRVGGVLVALERRAMDVLTYLLRHTGEVVSKEELLQEVWAGRVTVDQVLPNAINKLRRALGEANAERIATQARVGYRLDGPVARTVVGRTPRSEMSLKVGDAVPGRDNFSLQELIGKSTASEVWLARQHRTGERRVYKFAVDADQLRALKREVTLISVLRASLSASSHFVELIDWNFERAPYYLECEFGGPNLLNWADTHLNAMTSAQRLALFLQIADAVAQAHSVGVLHKDIKPANVLMMGDAQSAHARLTDFGSAHLFDMARLGALGISPMGMTLNDEQANDASGTPMYMAPELIADGVPSVQSDVYALGILLYQLMAGRMSLPMVSSWRTEISDPLLQEDIEHATAGEVAQRLSSAAEFASRLRRLEPRRAQALARERETTDAANLRAAYAKAQARKPYVFGLVASLALGAGSAIFLQQQALNARNEARSELARANAITRFLNEDLISRSNPLVSTKGKDATLKETLLAASERIGQRLIDLPDSEASVRASLTVLFNTLDLWPQAESEARRAIDLYESAKNAAATKQAMALRSMLIRILSRTGQTEVAKAELDALERQLSGASDAQSRYWQSSARSTYLIMRGEYVAAVPVLNEAISTFRTIEPESVAMLDSLRLDYIACLALASKHQAAIAQAQALIAQASQRKEDTGLIVAMAKLAVARAYPKDNEKAEALLLEAQAVIASRLGENHSSSIQVLGELLNVAFRQGDWQKAQGYAKSLHEQVKARLGEKKPLAFVTLMNWGRAQYEAGHLEEAAINLTRAHAGLLALLGPQSPHTQDAAFALAATELSLGRFDAVSGRIEALDAKVLEASRATGEWAHWISALRGVLLSRQGKLAEAIPLLKSALAGLSKSNASDRLYREAERALRERTRAPSVTASTG
jgi:eukaryotic-like serine/threonine-protein kinase